MSSIPQIPCAACYGHGQVDIPTPYRDTLRMLDAKWRDTEAVLRHHRILPVKRQPARTALINRLNALVRWGLVDRRGSHNTLEWRKI